MKRFKNNYIKDARFFLIENNVKTEIKFTDNSKVAMNDKKIVIYNNIHTYKVQDGNNEVEFNIIQNVNLKIIFHYTNNKIIYPTINIQLDTVNNVINELKKISELNNIEIGYYLILKKYNIIILFSQVFTSKINIIKLNNKCQKMFADNNYNIVLILFYDIDKVKLSRFKNINISSDICELKPIINNVWYYLNQFFISSCNGINFTCSVKEAVLYNNKYKFKFKNTIIYVGFDTGIEDYNVVDNMSLSVKLAKETQIQSIVFYYDKYDNILHVLFYKKYIFPTIDTITNDKNKCCYACKILLNDIKVNVNVCLLVGWDMLRRI